jgi:hypothetical protein
MAQGGGDPTAAGHPGEAPLRPLVRPARPSLPPPGSGQSPRRAVPWYRDRPGQVAGAVALGAALGALPGLALALGARIEAHAADRRALAAERTLRAWEQQASQPGTTGGASSPGRDPSPSPRASQGARRSGPADTRVAGDGAYRVGKEIKAGTWESTGNNACHWERLRDGRSKGSIMVAYGNPVGNAVVTLKASDDVFKTSKCNTWSRIG